MLEGDARPTGESDGDVVVGRVPGAGIVLDAALEVGYRSALERGWDLLRGHWKHPDFIEGPRAFVEKRDPVWNPDPTARSDEGQS